MKQAELRLLGPLTVCVDGRQIEITSPRERTVLALLALHTERVVSKDALIEAIWADRPPATARTQVAICVASLRRAFTGAGLAEELITTVHPGYRLNPRAHRLDLAEFRLMVAEAEAAVHARRPAEADQCYTRALGLWRGSALLGVASGVVEAEAERLNELRILAYEDAMGVRLELGLHHQAAADLARVVGENPLRESLRGKLMVAQYRCGRRAEALETFAAGRRILVDGLGIEPGPDLQLLHHAILRDDESLASPARPRSDGGATGQQSAGGPQRAAQDSGVERAGGCAPTAVPRELPPDVPVFVGRAAELRALGAMTGREPGVCGPTVGVITGGPGVGKSGLAVHWARAVAGCYPDGQLFADMDGFVMDRGPASAAEVLGRFLRSLGVAADAIPDEPAERAALYRSLVADRRVLIVLENVHCLLQVKPLLAAGPHASVLITSRNALPDVIALPPVARMRLGPLSTPEGLELLRRIVGRERIEADPDGAALLVEHCDRLPLALRIVGARLASKLHWTVRHVIERLADEQGALDELSLGESSLRAGFGVSYRHLGGEAACLLRRLSSLDVPDFQAWVGAALADCTVNRAAALIEQLADAQLVDVSGAGIDGGIRYKLHHLVRLCAREQIAEAERPELADAVDRALRSYLALAEQAHRREFGGDYTVLHSRVERPKMEPALVDRLIAAPLDWLEAERMPLLAVIKQAAHVGAEDVAWDLTMSMVSLFETRNYIDDWSRSCEISLAAATASGNAVAQAAMLHDLGAIALRRRDLGRAIELLDRASGIFRAEGEISGIALTLRNLSIAERLAGRTAEASAHIDAAIEGFRVLGDLSSRAHALNNKAQIELDRGETELALALAREAVRTSERIREGGNRSRAQSLHRLARVELELGRLDEAQESFLRVIALVDGFGDRMGLIHALVGLGEVRLRAGALGEAESTLVEALDLARILRSPLIEGQADFLLAEVCRRDGRTSSAGEYLDAARVVFERIGAQPWCDRVACAMADLNAVGAS
jgi:DNA-binding SARP family transcriptional activator/tetratricopeptide (TPR) repeat protein